MTQPEVFEMVQRVRRLTEWCRGYRADPANAGKTYGQFWTEHDAYDPELLRILEGYRGQTIPEPLKAACIQLWIALDAGEWDSVSRGSRLLVSEIFGLGPSARSPERAWLDRHLDELARRIRHMVETIQPEYVMEEFAGYADGIRDAAPTEHLPHVDARLDCILHKAGLVPGDPEEPCDDA
ncbi:hypothetical protein FQY83_03070 [Luteimonas marina]|uniref:Uncharacterized protein n=1 Tax=Luteimonas marina TaxID=488485 RepID=A0A5C5UDT3_9GAMM|nr:hypothetical protein [Luteimonas marina]TWT23625.1 hypothetical protein FQY83_03070 [Luteimonas marina]